MIESRHLFLLHTSLTSHKFYFLSEHDVLPVVPVDPGDFDHGTRGCSYTSKVRTPDRDEGIVVDHSLMCLTIVCILLVDEQV